MQTDYINTSHPCFIGGNKATELVKQCHDAPSVSTPMPISKVHSLFKIEFEPSFSILKSNWKSAKRENAEAGLVLK